MADLVMDVSAVDARRDGSRILVDASGEVANSRDEAYTEVTQHGDSADVFLRVRSAGGFGTQMTGRFSAQAVVSNALGIKTVRVHARSGVRTVRVD
jgi:hypothetical protein